MAFLQEKDKEKVKEMLAEMAKSVKLINFTQELECQFCRETRSIIEEVGELSENISVEVYNFQIDKEKTQHIKLIKSLPLSSKAPKTSESGFMVSLQVMSLHLCSRALCMFLKRIQDCLRKHA